MKTTMKTTTTVTILILGVIFIVVGGCKINVNDHFDNIPPAAPRGVIALALDNEVELTWYANTEGDLTGYNIYVSDSYNGRYRRIGSTRGVRFVDKGVRNGSTYYYAVAAYDYDGNESRLSPETAAATPRPEGYNATLFDYRNFPNKAGYDFSTYSIGQYDDKYTDVFFEYYNGAYYLNVWDDSDIQDMGYTANLDEILKAPSSGWSPSKDVRAIVGHTYVVWTWDNHFAKLRVISMTPDKVVFDWSYQLQEGNPYLKQHATPNGDRAPLSSKKLGR
jgi:hypothetical protein